VSVTPSLPPAAPGGDPAPAPATGANTARPADGGPVAPAATDAPAPAALDAPTGPDATAGAAVAGAATTGEERASTAERAPAAETTDPGAATTAARPTDRISPSGAPAVAVPTPDLASIDDSATAAPAPAGVSGVATEPSAEPRPAPDAPDAPVDVSASPPGASGAAARVEASAPVARAEGADRSAPPRTAEPPAEQLVRVLRPFRHSPTGSYRMDLELRPPELGRVELRVEVTDGLLNASLRVENETAAQVIRDALDTLRQRLEANGIRSGALHVDDGRSGAHRRDGRGDQPTPRPVPDDDVQQSRATEPAGASTSDSNLDVRI
jgi:hypothetical protein